jgi:predicted  nucleic acid-binding Zn-ribbon protein
MAVVLLPTPKRTDFEKEVLLRELREAPERIKSARKAVRQVRELLTAVEEEAKEREYMFRLEISFEKDPNGKPRYSNESVREAELARRKKADPEYRELTQKVKDLTRRLQEAEDELAYELDRFRSLALRVKLLTAETPED